jgi:hypothetical protein
LVTAINTTLRKTRLAARFVLAQTWRPDVYDRVANA